eukprot:Gregarina_sp_Poly_1__87@NODE_101_length_14427_cov_132_160237_g88_i0_p6_GENE_NODE_101_length_14427_cov_132_160237_g88_i0NODE_101_length_14427_cov_132_160237_g88_i0_p6_ORF_typecomplete_len279_score24_31ACPS/PF01648_20/8_8e02ACPS/PF01648_20/7_2e12Corona_3/PF04694_12/51Corona_3/PF04694_12/19_NODE_101_length_14427_cov_132_160237_g88_i0925710093
MSSNYRLIIVKCFPTDVQNLSTLRGLVTSKLEDEDLVRIDVQRFVEDKVLLLASRVLVRAEVAALSETPVEKVRIIRYGGYASSKPQHDSASSPVHRKVEFNISHDHNVCIGIFGDFPIGIDLMALRLKRQKTPEHFLKSMRHVFSEGEWEVVTAMGNAKDIGIESNDAQLDSLHQVVFASSNAILARVKCLLILWTLKESFMKFLGTGLKTDPRNLELSIPLPIMSLDDFRIFLDGVLQTNIRFKIRFLTFDSGYYCYSICYDCNHVDPEQLGLVSH